MKDSDHPQGDGSQSGHDTLTMKMMEHHSSGARSELDALPRDQVVRALDKLSGGSIPSLINRYSGKYLPQIPLEIALFKTRFF